MSSTQNSSLVVISSQVQDNQQSQVSAADSSTETPGTETFESFKNPTSQGTRAKHWCFTLNNPTENDEELMEGLGTSDEVEYIIYGREVGTCGTPHLQGVLCLKTRIRFSQVAKLLPRCHLSMTRRLQASIQYCKKDGEYKEFGVPPHGQGKRSDIENFMQEVKSGETSIPKLREKHPTVYAKYRQFCNDYIMDHMLIPDTGNLPLYKWQDALDKKLQADPDPRKIFFIVDYVGNSGKSWFARYYCRRNKDSQLILPSKKTDMAYMLRDQVRVILFDVPRSKSEVIQYDFLEEVKNGCVSSPKYESRMKFNLAPHIVCFMNEDPDLTKLSKDRYDITTLIEEDCVHIPQNGELATASQALPVAPRDGAEE